MPLVSLLSLWTCRLGFHISYSNFVYATLQCKHTFAVLMNCYTMIWCINSVTTNRLFFPGIFEPNEGAALLEENGRWSPRSRAARSSRPAAGRPVLQGLGRKFSAKLFAEKPLPPGSRAARRRPPSSGAAGVYFYKFRKQNYIFVKNKIEKL